MGSKNHGIFQKMKTPFKNHILSTPGWLYIKNETRIPREMTVSAFLLLAPSPGWTHGPGNVVWTSDLESLYTGHIRGGLIAPPQTLLQKAGALRAAQASDPRILQTSQPAQQGRL